MTDRLLLIRAAVVVALIRASLLALPFRSVCRFVASRPAKSGRVDGVPAGRLAWAVQVAARRIPAASCLTQALALQWLLAGAGHRALLRIGVAKGGCGELKAHAWVESRGEVLPGGRGDVDGFLPLLAVSDQRR